MPTFEREDAAIGYGMVGSGDAILWIPGGDAQWSSYDPLIALLPEFHHVGIDPRGVGETIYDRHLPLTIEMMAQDVVALVDHLGLEKVTLFGVSMGALIAQEAASLLSDRTHMAIVAGTYRKPSAFVKQWMQAEVAWRRRKEMIDPAFLLYHYAGFYFDGDYLADDANWEIAKEWLEVAFKDRPEIDTIKQWQACIDYEASDRLLNCETPFTVIAHTHDLVCPPLLAKDFANHVKNVRFIELAGGHIGCTTTAIEQTAAIIRDCAPNS